MPEPEITVITVTYNAEAHLEKTLDSVKSQTARDRLEYLLVDGASRDRTLEIIRAREKELDRWISEPDGGIYDAMEKGLKLARGRYVIFMNAGDRFASPGTVEKMLPHLDGTDFVYGDCLMVHSDGLEVFDESDFPDRLTHKMICSHQSLFARREQALSLGFDRRFTICADYHQLARAYRQGCSFSRVHLPVAVVELEKYTWAQLKKGLRQKQTAAAEVFGFWRTRPAFWLKAAGLGLRHGVKRILGISSLRKGNLPAGAEQK